MFAKLNGLKLDEIELEEEQSTHIVHSSVRSAGKPAPVMSTFTDSKPPS